MMVTTFSQKPIERRHMPWFFFDSFHYRFLLFGPRRSNSIMPFLIRKQAPNWEADAVIDGEISKTSLSDLRAGGKYVVM